MAKAILQLRDKASKKSRGGHIFIAPDDTVLQASINAFYGGKGSENRQDIERVKVDKEADIQPAELDALPPETGWKLAFISKSSPQAGSSGG